MKNKRLKLVFLMVLILAFTELSGVVKKTIMIPVSDGTGLETDIYFPDNYQTESYPVVLNRSPYDRTQKEESGSNMADSNVVFIAQSFRGTFGSEGTHGVFHTEGWGEHMDGYDTLKWITDQPWCNGKIATIGGSAEGLVQYFMAGLDEKPGLIYQIITVASGDLYNGTFFPGGILRENAMTAWLNDQKASFFIDEMMTGDMYSKSNDYWDVTDIFKKKENLTVPASHLSGWFDMFGKYQIDTFRLFTEAGAADQHLVIGPWDHNKFMTNKTGELTFPKNAAKHYEGEDDPVFTLLVHYFWPSYTQKPEMAAVTYYTIGDVKKENAPGNEWKTSDKFPPDDASLVTLSASANLVLKAGDCGEGEYVLKFDLNDPFPSICGNNLIINPGPCDVSEYRERIDVMSFVTEPFEEPTEITGAIGLNAVFSADVEDFDMVVILTDIYPDGTEYLMLEGAQKVRFRNGLENESLIEKEAVTEMEFNAGYISIIFDKGHRLGVHIAPAYFPKYRIPSTVADYWNDEKAKGEIKFDLSKTIITVDMIGEWGGEKCEATEEEPDADSISEADELNDEDSDESIEKKSSSGCIITVF